VKILGLDEVPARWQIDGPAAFDIIIPRCRSPFDRQMTVPIPVLAKAGIEPIESVKVQVPFNDCRDRPREKSIPVLFRFRRSNGLS